MCQYVHVLNGLRGKCLSVISDYVWENPCKLLVIYARRTYFMVTSPQSLDISRWTTALLETRLTQFHYCRSRGFISSLENGLWKLDINKTDSIIWNKFTKAKNKSGLHLSATERYCLKVKKSKTWAQTSSRSLLWVKKKQNITDLCVDTGQIWSSQFSRCAKTPTVCLAPNLNVG